MPTLQEAFIEDLRILWDRGWHSKEELARELKIKVKTLDRRINRARKTGALPPAHPGSPLFDPFGRWVHLTAYYAGNRNRIRTIAPKHRPPENSL